MAHTIKFISMVILLLVGIVVGMQTAEQGMKKIDGSEEQKSQTFAVTKVNQNQVDIAVMGKQIRTEPKKMVTYVSQTGESIGLWVKKNTETAIKWLSGFF